MADESTASVDTKPDSPRAIEKAKKKPAAAEAVDEEKAKKKPADDEEKDASDTEKTGAAAKDDDEEDEDGDGEPTKKARKQGLVLAAPVKEALLRVPTDALERLMALANTIKEAAEPEEGEAGETRRTSRASSRRSPSCSTRPTSGSGRRQTSGWRAHGEGPARSVPEAAVDPGRHPLAAARAFSV